MSRHHGPAKPTSEINCHIPHLHPSEGGFQDIPLEISEVWGTQGPAPGLLLETSRDELTDSLMGGEGRGLDRE